MIIRIEHLEESSEEESSEDEVITPVMASQYFC